MDFFKQNYNSEVLLNGQVFLIDKPLGWTSFQVVNKIRIHMKNKTGLKKLKVGHAGSLDPLATGLLIICTGKMTKNIEEIQNKRKTYTGSLVLGATTPSYDLETEVSAYYPTDHISKTLIYNSTKYFTGRIKQKPPIYSAIKKNGRRLYEYARSGKNIEIDSRNRTITKFEIKKIEFPKVDFFVECEKGTYIRSLVHDFGKKLRSGAYLSALKRTEIGSFSLNNAYKMSSVIKNNSK